MVENDPVDAFLAHHGIPGMRWGYRRQRLESHLERVNRLSDGTATEQDKAAVRQRRIRTAKTAAAISGAVAVAAGGLFVKHWLKKNGGIKAMHSARSFNHKQAKSIINLNRSMTLANLPKVSNKTLDLIYGGK